MDNRDISRQKPVKLCIQNTQNIEQLLDQPDNCIYNMTKIPHGYAVIFNQETFSAESKLEVRKGSHVDVKNLERLFHSLNYIVEIFNDFTSQEMEHKINYYSKHLNHKNYDSFICVFLSHGIYRYICARDGPIDLNKVFRQFRGHKCPTLAGKPKIFMIQACRGKNYDSGVDVVDSTNTENIKVSDDFGCNLPSESDFLLAYATTNNYGAFRNPISGSWFIQDLVTVIEKYHCRMDLLRMLTRVNYLMAQREWQDLNDDENVKKQSPSIVSRLRRDLYFTMDAAIVGRSYSAISPTSI